jgi:hypothetical protein
MMFTNNSRHKADLDRLIEIWKVLEILTVSSDRMGHFWLEHGEDAAKEALHQYMVPAMFEKISQARSQIISVMEHYDPTIMDRLEELADNEAEMGYWDGPTSKHG